MIGQEFLESVDVDWGYNTEKGGVVCDCFESDGIRSFGERRARKGGGGF